MTDLADAGERHLLVVDDDDRIRELLGAYLARQGYRVSAARDAAAAQRLLRSLAFDLLVVDVMMPGMDGLAFTRWLREQAGAAAATPVVILTARDLADERIQGLRSGADDYLAKPFEPEELALRIAAILRRAAAPEAAATVRLGACRFDIDRGELTREGAPIRLTETEARLLRRLALSARAAVDRAELAGGIAEEGESAGGRAVDIQVTRLRRKIEADPANPRYLQTVRGVGYRLAPD